MCVELGGGEILPFHIPPIIMFFQKFFYADTEKRVYGLNQLLFRFAFLHFIDNCIFYKLKVRINPALINLLAPFFQQHLLCDTVTFW